MSSRLTTPRKTSWIMLLLEPKVQVSASKDVQERKGSVLNSEFPVGLGSETEIELSNDIAMDIEIAHLNDLAEHAVSVANAAKEDPNA